MPTVYENVHFIKQGERLSLPAVPHAVGFCRAHHKTVQREYSWCTAIEYCVSGRLTAKVNGIANEIGPGDIYILPRHSRHEIFSTDAPRTKKYYLYYERLEIEHLLSIHGLNGILTVRGMRILAPYFRRLYQIAERCEADARGHDALLVEASSAASVILAHCALAVRDTPRHSDSVVRMRHFIDTRLHDPLTLADVSAVCGKSVPHAIRMFKRETGMTPIDYLILRRIETAAMLLTTTKDSLRVIAKRTGFKNEHYFSTVFKHRLGKPPSAFRA